MTSMAHLSMPNSIPMTWLYILTACMRVSSSFSFFANSLMSSIYIRWLIFSCDLLSLYPAVHFLSIWLSGIMAIMNSKDDRASPWKIPLWIFASANLLPPAVNSILQVFMVLSMKFMTSSDILYILRQCIIQPYHMPFCSQSRPELDFSVLSCSHLGCFDLCRVILLCLWILCGILSVRQGTIRGLLASSKSFSLFVLLAFSTSLVGRLSVCNCLEQFLCLSPFGLM